MRTLYHGVLVVGLALMVSSPSEAQERRPFAGGFGGGPAMLLANEGVQKELKLSEEQIAKVKESLEKVRGEFKDDIAKLRERNTPAEERGAISKKVNEATTKALAGILKEDQSKRLKQIELQQRGAAAFAEEDVQKGLKLTEEQLDKIKTINADAGKDMREIFQNAQGNVQEAMKKVAELRKEAKEKAFAVLSADQKKAWKELTGEPFEVKFEFRRRNNN